MRIAQAIKTNLFVSFHKIWTEIFQIFNLSKANMTMISNFSIGLLLNLQCDRSCWHSSRKDENSHFLTSTFSENAGPTHHLLYWEIFWLSRHFFRTPVHGIPEHIDQSFFDGFPDWFHRTFAGFEWRDEFSWMMKSELCLLLLKNHWKFIKTKENLLLHKNH